MFVVIIKLNVKNSVQDQNQAYIKNQYQGQDHAKCQKQCSWSKSHLSRTMFVVKIKLNVKNSVQDPNQAKCRGQCSRSTSS